MVKIKYWNKRKYCFDVTEFNDADWKNIVHSCKLAGIPLNCEVLSKY